MFMPKKRKSNDALLHQSAGNMEKSSDAITDLVSAISADRPITSIDELQTVSSTLSNVLAFMETSTQAMGSYESQLPDGSYFLGMGEVLQACRLISLRIEQYFHTSQEG